MNWEEKYAEFLKYGKDKLIKIGSENGNKLIEELDKLCGNQDIAFAKFLTIYGTFVSIDLDIKQEEYEFFRLITGVDASFNEFVESAKESLKFDVIKDVDYLVDSNPVLKGYVINLGLCICAYDGYINNDEKSLIERYWN